MQVKFPIQHIEGNLVFGADESVWGYYRIPLRDYTYRLPEEKVSILNEWVRLFHKIEAEMHLLSVPRFFDFSQHEQRLKEDIPDGPLKEVAESYISQMMERLREKQAESKLSRPGDTEVFLGVKLARTRRQKGLMYHLKDFLRVVHDAAGIEPYPILKEELKKARIKEEKTLEKLRSCIGVQRASALDLQYLIAHSAYRGIGEPQIIPNEKPSAQKLLNLITGEYVVEPQYIQVRQYHDGELREGYMQFVYITDLPVDIYYPGEEWLSWAHAFPFPVDVSVRIRPVSNEQAVKMLGKKKRKLMSAIGHTRREGKTQDLLLEETYFDSAEAEKELKKSGVPLLRTTVGFCVYAPTKKEMLERTRILIREYERRSHDMHLVVSPGDQLFAFHEFLPGSPIYVKDFTHWLKPEMVAGGAINAGQQLGDGRGMFIGFTGPVNLPAKDLSRPVFVHQALAAQGGERVETKSLAVLVVGLPGSGKSFLGALLAYQAIFHLGARVLLFDVKGERGDWPENLPGLKGGHVSLIRVGGDPKYQGMFDPFHVFEKDKAPLYATDFLAQLLQIERSHDWYHLIQQAIGEVSQQKEPSMKKVLERIRELDQRLYHSLALYQRYPFSQLVFGDRKPENAIELDKPLNIIQIDELSLPPRNKNPKHYNVKETLSVALMLPLTGFAHQVVKKDRNFNIIWWEEAWGPMASDQGREAIDQGIRMGRYWNSETLIVTQNPTDLPDELLNNIGMRFVFRTEIESEIVKALEILGLQNTASNRSLIKNLREGECFFRDIYGQVGRLKVDGLFKNLREAFDTTPPLEKQKPKEGVAG